MIMLSESRLSKLRDIVRTRQWDLTVILENVHDPHNLGAIMRSCEAIGIPEIYILYTEETHNSARYIGRNATSGVGKWIKPRFFSDIETCMNAVRNRYARILTTHLYDGAKSIYEEDLSLSAAILLGNEKLGLSSEAMAYADGNILIPIKGMAESLNVSVACSIIVFEAMRQRMKSGKYDLPFDINHPLQAEAWQEYLSQARPRMYEKNPDLLNSLVTEQMGQKKS